MFGDGVGNGAWSMHTQMIGNHDFMHDHMNLRPRRSTIKEIYSLVLV